jgi:hypothetical protein
MESQWQVIVEGGRAGNLHPGYVLNWNGTAEYQVSPNNLLKLMYAGSAGVHLVESWNVNVFPTSFGAGNPTLQTAALAATQNYLPFPQFGTITQMANTGHSTYGTPKGWCWTRFTPCPRRSTIVTRITARALAWRPLRTAT